ncbi:MAG: radical SAM protein, partial [Polyangiales bacterium]
MNNQTIPEPMRRTRAAMAFDDHPLLAIWEMTQACDLVCAHCRACATTERDRDELSTAEAKALLDSIAAMSVPLVVFTGGDPAKRPDLVELVAYGKSRGLTMAVTPSGTPLLVEETVAQLKEAGLDRLAISIDGPDAATHDAFRGVEGSFAHSMRIVAAAKQAGIPLQINTSVGPHNAKALAAMAELVRSLGAVLWSVFFVVPTGRAGVDLLLGPLRVEALLEQLADIAETAPFDVKTTAAPHFRRVLMQRRARGTNVGVLDDVDEGGTVKGPRGINDGSGFLFVSHRGDIYPSGFLPVSAGNVRVDDLATVYRTHPLFRSLRDESALQGK